MFKFLFVLVILKKSFKASHFLRCVLIPQYHPFNTFLRTLIIFNGFLKVSFPTLTKSLRFPSFSNLNHNGSVPFAAFTFVPPLDLFHFPINWRGEPPAKTAKAATTTAHTFVITCNSLKCKYNIKKNLFINNYEWCRRLDWMLTRWKST